MKRQMMLALALVAATSAAEAIPVAGSSTSKKPVVPERRKPAENDVPFVTIDSGASSGMSTRAATVVRDEGEWLALWRKHTSKQRPPAPPPHVDFGADMVVAVFGGERSAGGFSIFVERIRESGGRLVVTVSESASGPGSINTMALTQPFHIIKLARSSFPVSFQGI